MPLHLELLTHALCTSLDLHGVKEKMNLDYVVFRTAVETARFSRKTGLWTLEVRDLETNTVRTRTCNILISCLGGLSIPNGPPFDPKEFDGHVFHSAQWDHSVDIKNKDVVIVGNGENRVDPLNFCSFADSDFIPHQVALLPKLYPRLLRNVDQSLRSLALVNQFFVESPFPIIGFFDSS